MRAALVVAALLAVSCSHTPTSMALGHHSGASSGPYSVEVTDRAGRSMPTWWHRGRTYVMGQKGERYRVRVRNNSWRRIEAVISIDGRDAIDGKRADWRKPGYVIEARDELVVDGFRVSMSSVATFRFSSVRDSYAARMGDARDVGVIGVAIFEERPRPVHRVRPWRQPTRDYSREERYRGDDRDEGEASAQAPRAEAKAGAPAEAPAGAAGARSSPDRALRRHMPADRPGLGTSFGERRDAPAVHVDFVRANAHNPSRVLALRYDDANGLVGLGIDVWRRHEPPRHEQWRRYSARPFSNESREFSAPPPGWRP